MTIDIFAKNIDLNAPLRTFIEEKMADVGRTLGSLEPLSTRFEVSIPSQHHNSGSIFYAEAHIQVPGHLFRAEKTHNDLHSAIVDVKDELKTQIRRYKDKLREESRKPAER